MARKNGGKLLLRSLCCCCSFGLSFPCFPPLTCASFPPCNARRLFHVTEAVSGKKAFALHQKRRASTHLGLLAQPRGPPNRSQPSPRASSRRPPRFASLPLSMLASVSMLGLAYVSVRVATAMRLSEATATTASPSTRYMANCSNAQRNSSQGGRLAFDGIPRCHGTLLPSHGTPGHGAPPAGPWAARPASRPNGRPR